MSEKKILNTDNGERVDRPDFQYSQETALNHVRQNIEVLATKQNSYILHGFGASDSGATLTITKDEFGQQGEAIVPFRSADGVEYGHIVADGDASRSYDLSSLANGFYSVYISFGLNDSDNQNRAFWNADTTAGGPIEFVKNIPTRKAADWNVLIDLNANTQGDEWHEIWRFTKTGATLSLVDVRTFFFEGQNLDSWTALAEWGTANDRNTDRPQYGIKGLRMAIRSIHAQLESILGTTNWFDSVADSLLNKLNRDGTNTITGNIEPDSTQTHNLGSLSKRFATFFTEDADVNDLLACSRLQVVTDCESDLEPSVDSVYDLGTTTERWRNLYIDTITVTDTITSNLTPTTDGTYNLGSTSLRWLNVHSDQIDCVGIVTGTNLTATVDAPASPVLGRVYKDSVCFCRGYALTSGGGTITSSGGFNLSSVTMTGDRIIVTFNTGVAAVADYQVLACEADTGSPEVTSNISVIAKGTSGFEIVGTPGLDTIVARVDFICIGG